MFLCTKFERLESLPTRGPFRQGEKLYVELITRGEGIVPTAHEKIMVLRPEDGG